MLIHYTKTLHSAQVLRILKQLCVYRARQYKKLLPRNNDLRQAVPRSLMPRLRSLLIDQNVTVDQILHPQIPQVHFTHLPPLPCTYLPDASI